MSSFEDLFDSLQSDYLITDRAMDFTSPNWLNDFGPPIREPPSLFDPYPIAPVDTLLQGSPPPELIAPIATEGPGETPLKPKRYLTPFTTLFTLNSNLYPIGAVHS